MDKLKENPKLDFGPIGQGPKTKALLSGEPLAITEADWRLIRKKITKIKAREAKREYETALHESGHACAEFVLTGRAPELTSIVAGKGHRGITTPSWESETKIVDLITILLAGIAAVNKYHRQNVWHGTDSDIAKALDQIVPLVAYESLMRHLQEGEYDIEITDDQRGQIRTFTELVDGLDRAKKFVSEHWRDIQKFARALVKSKTLNQQQAEAILRKKGMRAWITSHRGFSKRLGK